MGSAFAGTVKRAMARAARLAGAGPQLRLLEDPIRLEFAAGQLTRLSGGSVARRLEAVLEAPDGNARLLAEFGLGGAHIALGDNRLIGRRAADKCGGRISSNRHIDLAADNIRIEIDGGPVAP